MESSPLEATLRLELAARLTVLAVSDSVEALLGFTREDFLSSRVRLEDLIHPGDSDIAVPLFSSQSPGEGRASSGSFNIRIRHADGKIRCIRGEYTRQEGPGGKNILDLLLQDAKSLWKGPEDLPLAPNLRAMLESTDDFIFFKDRNHVFTGASRNMIAGLDRVRFGPSLLGLTDYDIFPENFADDFYPLEKQVFQGAPVTHEIQDSQSLAGSRCWIDNRKYPIKDDNGQIIGLFGIARDITERVQANEKLKLSEESLRESQTIAGLGSYALDFLTGKWSSSDVLDQIFGIGKDYDRSVGNWLSLIHPEDLARMTVYFTEEVVGQRKPFDREYRIVRQNDGAERWVHGQGRLDLDAQGSPLEMHGTIQDITHRKQAEATLRQSEELLRLFIDHTPAGMAMFDREMNYLAASRRWVEDWGLVEREILGHSHYEIFPHIPEGWIQAHRCGLAGEVTEPREDYIERPDGQKVWTRWEVIPWRASDGAIGGIVLFSVDITDQKLAQAALRQSEELLRLFIEHAPAALSMYDRELRFLAVSRRWHESFSGADREVIGRSIYEILPEIPERWKEAHRRGLAGETTIHAQDHLERPDGTVLWLRWEVRPWRAADGSVGGIIIFSENITRQKEAEDRLRLFASVFTHAREGIFISAPDGTILEINEAFSRITGYSREETLGQTPRLLRSGLHSKQFYDSMWQTLLDSGQWAGEIWNRSKSGEFFAEMLTISAVQDEEGNVLRYVSLFSDITRLKENERKLEHIAHYDVLTALPNRVLLADRLRQAMAQAQRRHSLVAVAYLDLDGFKAVNDRYGHAAGDQLLTVLADRMKHALREGDTLARLGGDEFVAVLLDLPDTATSMPVLSRLLDAAAETAQVGELALHVSASVGVTFYPQAEEADADQLLRQADQAMYQAKLAGQNRFQVFDASRDRSVRGHIENLEYIRRGLRSNEFVLFYQPVVNSRTGVTVGAEALIRWRHPEMGLVPPILFLPVIEDHPLAIEIGEWVIDTALAQIEAWQEIGIDIPVSVNIGAQQLQQPNFVERLATLLSAHPRVKPSNLELEILENCGLQDMTLMSKVLDGCHSLGVSFVLDDFGTGYSSLTYLQRLPSSVLKIDQSLVREMLDDTENLTILEGILGLAVVFRRKVIAKGVETAEHGLMLLQLGCELVQGYGIARPMPASDLPDWLARWRPDPRCSRVPSVSYDDRPLIYAAIEHRVWITAFEAFLHGKRHALPRLDAHHCRLGAWLGAETQAGRADRPAFQALQATHQRLHALTAEILASPAHVLNAGRLTRLDEVHALRDELMMRLENLRKQL
jgi:diguanylate cyclase (GGDEF)-like protein/PAS domain S-box-containing protein